MSKQSNHDQKAKEFQDLISLAWLGGIPLDELVKMQQSEGIKVETIQIYHKLEVKYLQCRID